jgi:hypothetical protein
MKKLTDNDSVEDIAKEIWERMEVNQSHKVSGYGLRGVEKGRLVLRELYELDAAENVKGGKRVVKRWDNSIGGAIAHKCWRYVRTEQNDLPTYVIWRVQ